MFRDKYKLFFRSISIVLIIALLLAIDPMPLALADIAQSANYKLNGTLNEGGDERVSASRLIWQDVLGEPLQCPSQSANYHLASGFLPTIQSNPPMQTQTIPNFTWPENQELANAFDLDDYFSSPDNLSLTYTVSGNAQIDIDIDSTTHQVSFSQSQAWFGLERITFTAIDSQNNSVSSNEVALQVEGIDNPPVLAFIPDITVNENELIQITPLATDLDGDTITYSFITPLDTNGRWQTDYEDSGDYMVTVTAADPGGLSDSQEVKIKVLNVNRPPVLNDITAITANEGELVTINPVASDPDSDAVTFHYSNLFSPQGTWQTDYDDRGTYTVTVTASDGIDTVSKTAAITINNTNRPPQISLTLSEYTVEPNHNFSVTLTAFDPDSDSLSFVLNKDGTPIASGPLASNFSTITSFSTIGDHQISATVTDAGGLSVSQTKAVDVVNPNDNRDSINPIMGDFNGDSLSDLGLHNSDTGNWEICLSDEGVFRAASDWLSGFGTSKDWIPLGGDFNADGKTDVGLYNNTTGELQIASSTGSSFTQAGTWLSFNEASYSWQPFTGNFNADKYTDFGLYNRESGEVRIALGKPSGFNSPANWLSNFGLDNHRDWLLLPGDFNGDSLTDVGLFNKSTGEFKTALSNTQSFILKGTWINGYATNQDPLLSDFNHDGLTDIGYWDKTNGKWYYAVSTGRAFVDKGTWLANFGTSSDESAYTGDYNADGVTDAATFDRDSIGINRWRVHLSTHKPVDLLVEIDNGIGGKTQITYEYASKFENDLLPFPVYVAKSISLIDTLPADQPQEVYTQNFSYSGGWFDPVEREFRGFRKITVTDPITNNFTETYFYQGKPAEGGALKGKIEKTLSYDGDNHLISQTLNSWQVETAGSSEKYLGFPYLEKVNATVYERNISLSTETTLTYDNLGNVIKTLNAGDTATTGDEKVSKITYAPSYEEGFNNPLVTTLEDTEGEIYSKKTFSYDDRGNLLSETAWLFEGLLGEVGLAPTLLSSTYSYDSFGNIISTTNPKGSSVTTDYETDFYTFPETITNSLGHSISYEYNTKFGVVTKVTDTNGNSTATTYDSLARVINTKNAYDETVTTYAYPDFNTKITTQWARQASPLQSTQYIDGLGRNYKSLSQGEDGDSPRNVVSEVFFNNRGLKDKESLLHYEGESSANLSYIRYEYDLRGRIIRTTSDFPGTLKDASSSVSYLEPLYTESTDPKGHKKGARKDIYGNNTRITEFTQGGVYHTNYEYDFQGNLIKTIDSQSNTITISYDSLGRKTRMDDPDMGVWLYTYDEVGNLVSQTDAKGQTIEFEYDIINRLAVKRGLSPQGTVPVEYIYDDTDKENCIGRLSKVTDSSGSTEFFYDKLGREIKSTKTIEGTAYTVERTYDTLDRLTSLKYPDGEVVNYQYDSNSGNLERVFTSDQILATSDYVKDIAYDAQGKIKTISYGNSTQTAYTYGQDLRLERILTRSPADPQTLQDLYYNFDKNGNLTTLTDNLKTSNNIRAYTYDDLDRLSEARNIPNQSGGVTTFTYQYDAIGNMTYKSDLGVMRYGEGSAGPHAVTTAGSYSYRYDANGNMLEGKNKLFTYDSENHLLEVNESGTITTTFLYDGDGGRVKKVTSASGQQAATTYIGSLYEIEDTDGTTKIKKHIFAGANKVCTIEPEHTYYTHSDHLGSSNVITDETGAKVAQTEYQPYGQVSQQIGTDVTPYKFTGKELDNTGLYYYSARYYDPEIGRFIQPDTVVPNPLNPQTLNRYTYCYNNPLKYVDPTGHWGWIIWAIIGAIIGGASGGVAAYQNGGEIWKGALIGATIGAFSGATLGTASAPLILKLAAGFALASQVTGAMPGQTWASVSKYSGYTSMALAAMYTAWNVGVGIKDWAVGKGEYYDVKAGVKMTEAEVLAKYGEEGATIFTNGITSDLQHSVDIANAREAKVLFYNPTHRVIADLTESTLDWITGTSSLSRQLGSLATQMRVDLIGYSQGSIISSNALLFAGIKGGAVEGSSIRVIASGVDSIRLHLSAWSAGVTDVYGEMNWFDPIKLISSGINPIGYAEGATGLLTGGGQHTNY